MLTEGTRVRIRRFEEIPLDLFPEEAIDWYDEDPDSPRYIYGLSKSEIEGERANGDGIVCEVARGFDGVELDCKVRFDTGGTSTWRYAEPMLELLDVDDTPIILPESDPVSFLFA